MITIKMKENDFLDLLMNRVLEWSKETDYTYQLFEQYYSNCIDEGVFNTPILASNCYSINHIVDNDYNNFVPYVSLKEAQKHYLYPIQNDEIKAQLDTGEVLIDACPKY